MKTSAEYLQLAEDWLYWEGKISEETAIYRLARAQIYATMAISTKTNRWESIVHQLAAMDETDLLKSQGGYVCVFCECSNHDQNDEGSLNHGDDCLLLRARNLTRE